jgi:CRISPR-associated protein Cmr4
MFIIEALTNMHVGSGETHFGVVDNLIQRHPVTKIPIIHSSGIKGALKDHFENDNEIKQYIPELFGGSIELDNADPNGELDYKPGHLIFFEAQMLTLPLRASENVYYNCTSVPTLIEYLDQLDNFFNAKEKTKELRKWLVELDFTGSDFLYFEGSNNLEIEDYTKNKTIPKPDNLIVNSLTALCKIDINKLAIFNKDIFTRICEDSIPVVARNQIKDDGTSGNLFYEEVLPRKTSLFMIVGYDKYLLNDKLEIVRKAGKEFVKKLKNNGTVYQFGANYSVGYGFSKLSQIAV